MSTADEGSLRDLLKQYAEVMNGSDVVPADRTMPQAGGVRGDGSVRSGNNGLGAAVVILSILLISGGGLWVYSNWEWLRAKCQRCDYRPPAAPVNGGGGGIDDDGGPPQEVQVFVPSAGMGDPLFTPF